MSLEIGTIVINDHPNSGYVFDREQNQKYLVPDSEYTIIYVRTKRGRTMIWLSEIPTIAFDSVQFTEKV